MKKKKMPLRKCISCGENKEKRELIRIVKNKEGEIKVDLTGKANGRGAYICSNINCLEALKKSNKLAKALGVSIPDDIYIQLAEVIDDN